jgi:hypothetical protein
MVHWSTWIGCNVAIGLLSFILAEAIPVFNYILSLEAALFFAPMSLFIPACCWMHDFPHYRVGSMSQKVVYGAHLLIAALASFMIVGGT